MQGFEDVEVLSAAPSQPGDSSANSSRVLYNPQVKNDLIPKMKQKFQSLEDGQKFYNNYAKACGFSIRINSSKLGKEGQVIRKEYVCYKEGLRSEKNTHLISEKTIRKRGLTREGCGAKMSIVKDKSGGPGYEAIQFFEGHNHPLASPRRVHLLPSHRRVSGAKKALTQQLAAANVPPSTQMSILELQAGGLQNVGFLERDLLNAERDRRKMLQGHDANMLYEYFENEKQNNSSFMFSWEPSDDGTLLHCFWVDATCRKSYKYFGEVVVFDTTYNTNRYGLIFAPILGVNHHGQTTLFGCAFLSGEKSDAFDWLFNVWLNAMPGAPPKMIITDQDPAMAKTIATLLPNSHHRFCIWHIVSKFSEKIGALAYKEHYDEFSKCIWNSESREEFEETWVKVVKKANLDTNDWLNDIYKIRDRWVPVYMRHIFSAGMTSSQRAESCHSFFKKYVSPNNSLMDFVTRFQRALSRLRHNELDLDHKDVNEKPLFKTSRLIESKMSELYTQALFYEYQEELFQSGAYVVTRISKDAHRALYYVRRDKEIVLKGREVSVDKSSNFVSCSCKMFQCEGIPCRHMLAYFTKKMLVELPNEYILRRWTKSAKASRVMDRFADFLGLQIYRFADFLV